MIIESFFALFLGTLLGNGEVIASSMMTFQSYGANINNSGSADLLADTSHSKKELVDRVKDLEFKFQQHVSESKTERENQYEKIVILRASKKNQDDKLKLILNEMEVLKAQNRNQMARIVQLEKLIQTKTVAAATSPIQSVARPSNHVGHKLPTSCEDLNLSGHHLNGIYMVFDANVKKVLATYCDFHQSSVKSIGKKVIGSLSINTLIGGVYFYAQMKTSYTEVGKPVPFDWIVLNQGNGLNPTNKGVFTAPRDGIYHFTFKGNTPLSITNHLVIELRHNGVIVGDTGSSAGLLHIQATLKLKAGDKISIFKSSAGNLYSDKNPDTHFSGWLLEEDVSIM